MNRKPVTSDIKEASTSYDDTIYKHCHRLYSFKLTAFPFSVLNLFCLNALAGSIVSYLKV